MSVRYRPTVLSLLALVFALTLPCCLFGQQTAWDVFNRMKAKLDKGDLDGAIVDYSKAIELNPKDADAYNTRGNAKMDRADWDGAIADYSKAIELNPKLIIAYTNRGNARKAKGDQAGADAGFAQAAKLQRH